MKTVKQVSELTGLSIRMLHYYDKIGLFKPSQVSEAGYRLYSDDDLEYLQQILFFKELDFQLKDIKTIITNPSFDKQKALENHKHLLTLRRNRLNKLIKLVDKTLKGELDMSFKEFDISEIERIQKKYAKEAQDLYGNKEVFNEYLQKTGKYDKDSQSQIGEEIDHIFRKFADVIEKGVDSKEAQELVKEWQNFITKNFYNCTDEILKGLGKLYVQDERFAKTFNKYNADLADFISQAIEIYCSKK